MTKNNWTKCKLGDVATVQGGFAFKSKDFGEVGSLVLKIKNVQRGKIDFSDKYYISNEILEDLQNFKLADNDVLISMTGSGPSAPASVVGRVARYKQEYGCCFINQRVGRFIVDEKRLDKKFLYYCLLKDDSLEWLVSNSTGSANQANISSSIISNFSVNLPSLEEQKRIAGVLGAFDDKIELLQKQNKTLEDMAKAIFKSWFVDFDIVKAKQRGEDKQKILSTYKITEELYNLFPSSFTDAPASSSLGPIPTGWEVKPLSSIATYLNGLALQKYPIKSGEQGLPAIKIAELRNGISSSTDIVSFDVPKEYIINTGDILFSWSGSLMIKIWTEGTGALNQHLFKVSSGKYPKWFFYLWTEYHMPEFVDIAADKATTMGHIQRKHLDNAMAYIPNGQLIKAADFFIAPILEKQINNAVEIQTLTELRDGLLPRLLSGKLQV